MSNDQSGIPQPYRSGGTDHRDAQLNGIGRIVTIPPAH